MNSFKRRSDSSSYSEDSDNEDGGESSTSTSLCDDLGYSASSVEASPIKKKHSSELPIDKVHRMKLKKSIERSCAIVDFEEVEEPDITKSVSDTEDNKESEAYSRNIFLNLPNNEDELANTILSISQLSPMPDISKYFESSSSISPLKTPSNFFDFSDFATDYSNYDTELDEIRDLKFEVDDEGVTNELFERINLERSDTELNEYIFSKPGPSESEINATDIEKLSPLQKSGSSTSLNFENIGSQQIAPFTLEITNTSEMNIQACDENLSKNLNDDVVALNSFSPEDSISSDSSSKMTKLIEENSRMLNDMLRRSVSEDLNLTIDTIMEESEPTTPLQDIVMLTDHIIFSKTTKNDETFEMISRKTLNIICEETIPEEAEESEVTPTNKHFENVEEIVKKSDIIPEILISLHEDSETESSFEIIESTTDLWEPPEVAVEPLPILEKENIVATKSFQDKIVSSYDEAIELIEKVTQENASYEDENMMVCSKTITESSDATVQTPNTSYVNEQVIRCIKEPIQINAEIVPDNQLIDLPNKNILDSFKNIENNDNINPITLNEKCLEEETWNIACYQENNQTIYRNISPIDLLESSTKTKNIPFLEQRPEDIINELLASKDVKHVRAPNTETFNFYKHEDDDSNKFSRDQCSVQGMDKNADNIPSESQTINLLEADKNSALSNSEKILENLNIQLARYSQYVKIEKELKFPSDLIVCEKVEEKKSIKYHDEKLENVEEHSIKIQEYEENTTSIREKADIFENLQKPFIDDAHIELSQLNQEDVSSVSFKNEKTILKKHDLKHKDFYHKIELKGEFKSQDDLKPYPIEKSASDKVLEKLHLQLDKYDEIPIKSPQVDQSDRLPYNKSLANLEELLNKNDGISNASSLQASYSSEKTPVEDESTLQSFSESGYQPLSDAKREFYLNSVYDLLNQDYKKDGSDKELVIKKPQKTNSNDSICSSTSTISDTLSSIKNSIKSIDSLCQKKSEYSNAKRRNKTIEDIEKICENDKDWKIYKRTVSPITTINQDPYSEYAISRPKDLLNDSNSNSLKPTKMARDRSRSRDRTPRGKRNDSIDDYNLQNVRDPSPRIAIKVEDVEDSSRKYYGTYDNDNYKSPTSKSPTSYKSEKGMIRQASVTSTFYDRFQYYKKEQNYDNSPVSPPKNLSHSPRSPRSPAHTSTSSFHLKSPTSPTEIRASKSAENSPSRYLEESIKNYKSTLSPGRSSGSIYKSYDDISERVNAADKKFKDLTTRSNQYREFEPFDENIYFRKKTS